MCYKYNIRGTQSLIRDLISYNVPRKCVNRIIWNSSEYCHDNKIADIFNNYLNNITIKLV